MYDDCFSNNDISFCNYEIAIHFIYITNNLPSFNVKNRLQLRKSLRKTFDESSGVVGMSFVSWKLLRSAIGTYYLWIFGRQPKKTCGGRDGIISSLTS